MAGGAAGSMLADAFGQGAAMAGGTQACYNWGRTMGAGAAGGLGGGIGYGAGRLFSGLAGRACFPAGTPIETSSGEKPIEEIKVGDMVLSADPETGKQSYQRVERTFVRQADELLKIVTEDGRSVEATPDHPFWVKGKGFVEAKRLARSDLLKRADGQFVAVREITSRRGQFTVYNFEVANTHSYFAGQGQWWVHNANYPDLDALSGAAGAPDRGGLTAAGRAFAKHGGRPNGAFGRATGNPSQLNQAGQNIVDDILTSPGSTTIQRHHALYGDITEIRAPDGRGVRFGAGGNFLGLLEP